MISNESLGFGTGRRTKTITGILVESLDVGEVKVPLSVHDGIPSRSRVSGEMVTSREGFDRTVSDMGLLRILTLRPRF